MPQPGAGELSWSPAPVEGKTAEDGSARLEVAPSIPLLLTAAAPGFVAARLDIARGRGDRLPGPAVDDLALHHPRRLEVPLAEPPTT